MIPLLPLFSVVDPDPDPVGSVPGTYGILLALLDPDPYITGIYGSGSVGISYTDPDPAAEKLTTNLNILNIL